MSIGAALLTKENLALVKTKSWKFGRPLIIEAGRRYYDEHPEEIEQIVNNLNYMGLPSTGAALDEVLIEISVHYYEKLFALTKTYEIYWIAKNRIEIGDTFSVFEEAQATNKAVFIGQSHFGATYMLAAVLVSHGISPHMIGKYPDPVGRQIKAIAQQLQQRYQTGLLQILNVADPAIDIPMEMIRLLMTQKVVSNVFDENNQFCKPVTLMDRTIMGGTGMDLILRNFDDEKVIVVTPFVIRTSDETFRFELDRHRLSEGKVIDSFFQSLEKRVRRYHPQWYFIHELHHSFIETPSPW